MGGDKKSKSKRRRRDREEDDDDDKVVRRSLVDYSKVADRHVDDERFEKQRQAKSTADTGPVAAAAGGTPAGKPKQQSSQMAAVMRLMQGKEQRTIAEKLADSNRPTWEQYKKDNEDKLNIEGLDQKKMDEYRKELDEQREKLLTRGTNHGGGGGGKDDKKKKKKKKKHSKRHDDSYSDSYSSDDYSSDDGRKSRKRKKHSKKRSKKKRYDSDSSEEEDRKKSSKHKKKKDKKRKRGDNDDESSGDSYRLSAFFTKGSDDESN